MGRNFIPHITGGVRMRSSSDFIGKPTVDDEGFLDHAYVPSFMHERKRDYPRSFGVQFNYQNQRSVGWARRYERHGQESTSSEIKKRYPAYLTFTGYHEMLPNKESYIDLDPDELDQYGLPMRAPALEAGRPRLEAPERYEGVAAGRFSARAKPKIHSVSRRPLPITNWEGAAIGADLKHRCSMSSAALTTYRISMSWTRAFSRSASEKNPTLTIMALASRTADHIADRLKKGEV